MPFLTKKQLDTVNLKIETLEKRHSTDNDILQNLVEIQQLLLPLTQQQYKDYIVAKLRILLDENTLSPSQLIKDRDLCDEYVSNIAQFIINDGNPKDNVMQANSLLEDYSEEDIGVSILDENADYGGFALDKELAEGRIRTFVRRDCLGYDMFYAKLNTPTIF